MSDDERAPDPVLAELAALRRRVAELEARARDPGRESDALASVLDCLPVPAYFKDAGGVYRGCNRAFEEFLGLPRDGIVGRTAFDVAPLDLAATYHAADRDLIARGGVQVYETQVRRADGSFRDVMLQKATLADAQGRTTGLVGVVLDITERKRAERSLRESEERYRVLVENMGEGIGTVDAQERFVFANPAAEAIFGVPPGGLVGRSVLDFVDGEDREVVRTQTAVRRWGERSVYELNIVRPGGERRVIQVSATPRLDEDGGFVGTLGIIRDVTERRQVLAALHQSEENVRAYLNAATESAILIDQAGTVLAANTTAAERLGLPLHRFVGRVMFDLFPPDLAASRRARVEEVFRTGEPVRFEDERAGTAYLTSVYPVVSPGGLVRRAAIFAVDITERRRAEEERARFEEHRRQAQKIEAIGRLAGGIAHDFNNILMGVLGAASLLRRSLGPASPDLRKIETIEKSATHAAALSNQLLAFARGGEAQLVPVDLDEVIQEALELIPSSVRRKLRIVHKPGTGLPLVDADRGQLVQVVMNLCQNAEEAMGDRGVVTIETAAADPASLPEPLRAGGAAFVALSVWDTGPGIPDDQRTLIFDPFFTTKDYGRGLGLSVVYGILHNHGGGIACDRAESGGARFTVYLPASSGRLPAADTARRVGRVTVTILLAEPEKVHREMAKAMLESTGHRVMPVSGGSRAIDLYRRNRDRIDIVLLDAGLAAEADADVLRRLLRIRPDARVVLTTVYGAPADLPAALAEVARGTVAKPFDVRELAVAVRKAIAPGA
jgi:PAS domain S-box-containing protein